MRFSLIVFFFWLSCQQILAQTNQPGQVDTTFNYGFNHSFFLSLPDPFPGFGATGNVIVTKILPDQKIIVGGEFTTFNGRPRNYIARLNAIGSVDTLFDVGSGANNFVQDIAVQSDGKVIIGGSFNAFNGVSRFGIARLNANGSLDTAFNPGTGANGIVFKVAIQNDGKIVIGGSFTLYNGVSRSRVARLNTNGSLDTTFNPGTGLNNILYAMELQNDGKVVIGGSFTSFNGTTRNRVVRLNTNGSLDTSFNPGTGASGMVRALTLLPDQKILIGGDFTTYNSNGRNRFAKLNTNGTLDASFTIGTGANNSVWSIKPMPDGNILIGGSFTTYNGTPRKSIARIQATGGLNPNFIIGPGPDNIVRGFSLYSNSKILINGNFTSYEVTGYQYLLRIDSIGNPDNDFNTPCGPDGTVTNVIALPNGQGMALGTFSRFNQYGKKGIVRLNSNATVDTSFIGGSGASAEIRACVLQPDGKLVIGGGFGFFNDTIRNRLARVTPTGFLDPAFQIGSGFNSFVSAIAIQPDGKIIVGGNFNTYNGSLANRLIRLLNNGVIDTSFNVGLGPNFGFISDIALQPDGKIICSGNFSSFNGVSRNDAVRLNTNGSLDLSFDTGSGTGGIGVSTMQYQPDGKVLIAGSFFTVQGVGRSRIARLNNNGSLDTTFVPGGIGFDNAVLKIRLQPDGKILASGAFLSYANINSSGLVRINSDGSFDQSFNVGLGSGVLNLALQSDGNVLICGNFSSFNSIPRFFIARVVGNIITGIGGEESTTDGLEIFPNPSSLGYFQIMLKEASDYQLFDLQGRLLKSGHFSEGTHHLNTDAISDGMLILRLQSTKGTTSYKLIKE